MRNQRPTVDTLSAHDDPEVVQVLEYYLAELEANRTPDRATLLAEHPEIAEPLAECLDGLEFLHKAVATNESASQWPTSDRRLGDYRLVRQIGRGGMGTVYEAISTVTGGRVAVKVLNHSPGLTDLERRRFDHEIHAASSLAHPHIVPIISMGNDRGVQFFAMRYIDGHSLADAIPRLSGMGKSTLRNQATRPANSNNPPSARRVNKGVDVRGNGTPLLARRAEQDGNRDVALMLQAADALGHAHAVGIVHRDVKPANLLLDETSQLWVADFGLAFVPGLTRITQSAALVGTLRYMSPEQVEPRRGVVDHRADLYGLGATFYEVFTGQPVYKDEERAALIHNILNVEPTPPREINPTIPYDIETILLKLLEKDPARRYASMADLADDLKRFLSGQRIHARRPSVWDRAFLWLDQNRRLAATVAIASMCFLMYVAWNYSTLREAFRKKTEQEAVAGKAVDAMYTRYAETVLAREPHQELAHHEFLAKALAYYQNRVAVAPTNQAARFSAAVAWRRIGDISHRLGHSEDSLAAYDRALAEFASLGSLADTDAIQREQAIAYNDRGNIHRASGRFSEAVDDYSQAGRLFAELSRRAPDELFTRVAVAGVENNRGLLFQSQHRLPEAKQCFEAASARFAHLSLLHPTRKDFLNDAASCRHNWAVTLAAEGQDRNAEAAFRDALTLREEAVERDPESPVTRRELARTQMMFAEVLRRLGKRAEAVAMAERAMAGWRRLAVEFSRVPVYQVGLTTATATWATTIGQP